MRRTLVALALWVSLTGASAYAPVVSLVVVLAAAVAGVALSPPGPRLRLRSLLRFVPFFLRASLRGSVDVARRALSPSMPIDPGFYDLTPRLPRGAARSTYTQLIGLLPGTLAASAGGGRLRVHALDRRQRTEPMLRALEDHVAALFGLELPPGSLG